MFEINRTSKAERRPTLSGVRSANMKRFVHFLKVEVGNLSSHSD